MRVASRRLRSALSDFKPFIRKDSIPSRRLKSIAKSLGAVRDEDVVLAALEKLKSKAGDRVAQGIETLVAEHRGRRQRARALLEPAIRLETLAELCDDFRSQVRATVRIPADAPAGEADRVVTFRQVGVKVIVDRLRQLSKAGDAVYRPRQTKKLHELRILAKRLRYAVELFAVCWGQEFRKFADEIARFQTSLGELHDCDVWIDNMGARLKQGGRLKSGGEPDGRRDNETVVWLLHHFAAERTTHYCHALERWHKWESELFLDQLGSMLDVDVTSHTDVSKGRKNSSPKNPVRGKPKLSVSSR